MCLIVRLQCSIIFKYSTRTKFSIILWNVRTEMPIKKITEDANNNKGMWNDATLEEIKVHYGVLIMMDIIKLDRGDLYWKEDEKYFMLGN